ncbi:hypothetical protein [Roseimicrobium gellanilyticum]|nr:hypothetical protein [Roseimicrobium gellanilyticum]
MPSFRPDGSLDRLNHGGGSKLPKTIPGEPTKVQKYPDFFRAVLLMAHQKAAGVKKVDPELGYTIPYGQGNLQGSKGAGQSPAQQAGTTAGTGMSGQRTAPAATSAEGGAMAPRKKRTLLSGGGALSQPYGSDTILGG